ncbi:MAG: transglycosylase [Gallionellales bacterium RIFCSPLOWO2_12_FULL_59_22]|nr:MAG: transglycosylase [Gallionellales bacterium RIFCSPLOWO2_02_FULL_59_110]OGT02711.1 MAG: transglycosylase [Gallionellales bacterium RIFCSPLOWO2_02_58_13]OGT11099.1 MAG: transglycosylase [Gallionellales bacterium RIFCSPLOWO2_12_FULL_59_22]
MLLIFLAACAAPPKPPTLPPSAAVPPVTLPTGPFSVSKWEMLPDWQTTDLQPAWAAFLQSCRALNGKPDWRAVCTRTGEITQPDNAALRAFFEDGFTPYQVFNPDGSSQGLVTGYYEPKLAGSRVRTERFRYPLFAVPDDLLTIDLGDTYPQLKGMRLRGRLQGKRIMPYYNRAEIETGKAALQGRELFWVDNAVELFFLQIQGSGRIELPNGNLIKIGYAEQNGHPYVSIGKKLVETGELKLEEASMQGIKNWAERNPEKLDALLAQNPSYVFFRELPDGLSAPLGALGVPLTETYSIAVDPRTIPLGAPVFLATTYPNTAEPLNRLMLAQDTGGAIKGAVRADFFWGFGEQAGIQAGRMKQNGQMWVLFPKGAEPALAP